MCKMGSDNHKVKTGSCILLFNLFKNLLFNNFISIQSSSFFGRSLFFKYINSRHEFILNETPLLPESIPIEKRCQRKPTSIYYVYP
jgi:hypothetical protein